MRKILSKIFPVVTVSLLLLACNGTKFVGNDELLLTHNNITSSDPKVEVKSLAPYLRQHPNTKWFSAIKVPLGIYSMAGKDTTKAINRLLHKWGEAPVTLDSTKIEESRTSLTNAIRNRGYVNAQVSVEKDVKDKRVKINYNITPNKLYHVRNVAFNITDKRIDSLMNVYGKKQGTLFRKGEPFSVNSLEAERIKITSWLHDQGYYYFNKEAITYFLDSCSNESYVDITMNLGLYRRSSAEALHDHPYYTIRNVNYTPAKGQKLKLRSRTLDINTLTRPGELYKASNVQKTYNKFAKLQTIRSTNIHFTEVDDSTSGASKQLDADILITRKKPYNILFYPVATNTAGDFGAALSLTYENRNLFHGGEVLSLQALGAFEAIKGLDGYKIKNYEEYGVEGKITFPELLVPWISRNYLRRHNSTSELVVRYNRQNRPEFHRRVFTAGWRYRWQSSNSRVGYTFDFIDVDYVSMPWISDTFKQDYLDSYNNRNAILRYNYEDLLIIKTGFGFTYSNTSNFLKINVETAGNVLQGLSKLFNADQNDEGQYKFALVAFAQYLKTDVDFTHIFNLDERNSLALHARLGVGIPYGNSSMLPYEKRYFSGGANSVRGWSVRELGPGRFRGTDGRIDFINQTGDIKIDLNAELRTNLFWKLQGAFFLDAGNVWTIRTYKDQPGGTFKLRSLFDEMAVAYGVGLRLNFDYFILRLDLGMKAVNPDYLTSKEHFPIVHPIFSRDYALHFAVGMPF